MTKKESALKGNDKVIAMLNHIMESELAGVVRYTEPPRVCRRLFRLSHAANAGSSICA